ncbi:septal ring lytic transglycosylase RlpA family protein [Psychrobium sp. 1_MG-2023]|uniref:septal ring lytic transglycosylase RlpA family protein n=1 Tax=Psychrobium sp. 1_MG-2023 TaxID=3062624 RepID=UPI000C3471DA|nr:septal ring lytic transglycosylase RlpA family protein [Psychrobium sp. 1_MG-2023]MDP2561253.1 septal ring lytic transglycosylase RlpA family protein [Psychrobium sp. 1_MG-2023]PKF55245.1 septal ring lytic transglycosylase RlpA [Alteromonadales bacterium alter-6D02]
MTCNKFYKLTPHLALVLLLGACSTPSSRYSISQDIAPERAPTAEEVRDITPTPEPYSRGGNKDYTVRGISYQVMKDSSNYQEEGIASWYGSKFHGHLTSNGETYNMFTLSAAHKSLPLPSFVKVTNLENNKQTIVRVNDRGPFHPDRVIDLSYGAAYKLGVLKHGTARVKLEIIDLKQQELTLVAHNNLSVKGCAVQLAASSDSVQAEQRTKDIATTNGVPYYLEQVGKLYRMKLGPMYTFTRCQSVLSKVENIYPKAFIKRL